MPQIRRHTEQLYVAAGSCPGTQESKSTQFCACRTSPTWWQFSMSVREGQVQTLTRESFSWEMSGNLGQAMLAEGKCLGNTPTSLFLLKGLWEIK